MILARVGNNGLARSRVVWTALAEELAAKSSNAIVVILMALALMEVGGHKLGRQPDEPEQER